MLIQTFFCPSSVSLSYHTHLYLLLPFLILTLFLFHLWEFYHSLRFHLVCTLPWRYQLTPVSLLWIVAVPLAHISLLNTVLHWSSPIVLCSFYETTFRLHMGKVFENIIGAWQICINWWALFIVVYVFEFIFLQVFWACWECKYFSSNVVNVFSSSFSLSSSRVPTMCMV